MLAIFLVVAGASPVATGLTLYASQPDCLGYALAIAGGGFAVLALLGYLIVRLAQSEQALYASEDRIADFLDLAVGWFWETDSELRLTFLSDRFHAVTGIPAELTLGQEKQAILRRYLADKEGGNSEKWRLLNERIDAREDFRELELALDYPGGAGKLYLNNGKPFFHQNGDFAGYRGSSLELAGQSSLSGDERLVAMGQRTATVAHELRNPLGTIVTSTAVLRQRTAGNNGSLKKALDRIDRSVWRCDAIITELLDFARARGLQPVATDIDRWLKCVLDEFEQPEAVKVERRLGLKGLQAAIDGEALRRAVVNLLDNACQAMTQGNVWGSAGRAKYLTVSTRRRDDRIEIEIADTGPGIPETDLPHVTEPLFSTRRGGTGLGLPTVQQILEKHGGGIEIDSVWGLGTRVTLWLPAGNDEQNGLH